MTRPKPQKFGGTKIKKTLSQLSAVSAYYWEPSLCHFATITLGIFVAFNFVYFPLQSFLSNDFNHFVTLPALVLRMKFRGGLFLAIDASWFLFVLSRSHYFQLDSVAFGNSGRLSVSPSVGRPYWELVDRRSRFLTRLKKCILWQKKSNNQRPFAAKLPTDHILGWNQRGLKPLVDWISGSWYKVWCCDEIVIAGVFMTVQISLGHFFDLNTQTVYKIMFISNAFKLVTLI